MDCCITAFGGAANEDVCAANHAVLKHVFARKQILAGNPISAGLGVLVVRQRAFSSRLSAGLAGRLGVDISNFLT